MTIASDSVVFIGVGSSAIERKSERGLTAFALDAALAAIEDAGLARDDIDGYVGAPAPTNSGALHAEGSDEVTMRPLLRALGIKDSVWCADLYKGFPTDMAIAAAYALKAGECRYVLGMRAMANPSGIRYTVAGGQDAYGEEQFQTPFGYSSVGARFATRARLYLEQAGASRKDLYQVVASARRHARRNSLAVWRNREVTLDEYLESPMVASPLCRFDCDMPVYGAAAFVITLGRYIPQAVKHSVVMRGWSGYQRPHAVFEKAGLSPGDINLAQLYDGFSTMVPEWLEGFGLCAPFGALNSFANGEFDADGRLPLNTFGGSLGEGRLHGMGHLREAILQTSGRAGERQIAKADHCLVQIGPYDIGSFLITSRTSR